MPRIARVVAQDIPHHIVQRGNRSQPVFLKSSDKTEYLNILKEHSSKYGVEFWAYCLMDNHVHFIAVPRHENSFALFFREAHKIYTRMINFREGFRGHMWEDRPKSFPLDEAYLVSAVRYVERNPVTAKMVQRPENYAWSSARSRIFKTPDPILSKCFLDDEIHDWGEYLYDETDSYKTLVTSHLKTGRPLGDSGFITMLENKLNRKLSKDKPGPKRLN